MSNPIVSFDEQAIKSAIRELVRQTVEDTLNGLLEEEAGDLVGAGRYERAAEREAYRAGHHDRKLVTTSGEQTGREGCLSLPNVGGDVTRPSEVTVQYLDAKGVPQMATVRGFLARAVCHETDHLKGILYVDHMDEKSREKVIKKLQKKK